MYRKNDSVGMVVLRREDGPYAIFEITGDRRASYNDRIVWDEDDPGTARNLTRGESYTVMMQEREIPEDTPKAELDRLILSG